MYHMSLPQPINSYVPQSQSSEELNLSIIAPPPQIASPEIKISKPTPVQNRILNSTANTSGTAHGYKNEQNNVIDVVTYKPEKARSIILLGLSISTIDVVVGAIIYLNKENIISTSKEGWIWFLAIMAFVIIFFVGGIYNAILAHKIAKRIYARKAMQLKWEKLKSVFDDILPDARGFSKQQSQHGRERAGGICEYTHTKTMKRCTNKIIENDHFYPHFKGGATTLQNFVGACGWHNQAKKANIWEYEKLIIEERRKTYFPNNESVIVGQWLSDFDDGSRTAKTEKEIFGEK